MVLNDEGARRPVGALTQLAEHRRGRADADPAAEAWVRAFARHTGATGQLAFDFVETRAGVIALECNPRLTSGIHLFRDMPAVVDALLGPTTEVVRPPAGQRFFSALALRHYGVAARPGRDLVRDPADPWPHRLQGLVWGALVARAAWHRTDPRSESTRDIEWNGEAA